MKLKEALTEIETAFIYCQNHYCSTCPNREKCAEVFLKDIIEQLVYDLSAQCKAFNEFTRVNRKE